MKTTVLEPEAWKRVIEFEVPAEEVDAAIEAKLSKFRRDARLPGFRQGKVPLNEVRRRFGDAARAEVIEDTVKDAYKAACEEHKIEPVCGAALTDMKNDEGEPLRFTIETEVDPPIEVLGYDKLKVTAAPKKIKDSDVEESFQSLLERLAEFKDVDRPAAKGDYARIEYRKVVIDGEARADIKTPEYPILIGGDNGLKEFDKALVGASAGDEAEVTVKFPDGYADRGVAGKTGEFSITVLSVQEKSLPEVNDEFLKKFGNYADFDAFKKAIRQGLEGDEAARARRDAHNEAVEELIRLNPFDVPPSKVENFIDATLEDYAQNYGAADIESRRDELAAGFRDSAVTALKRIRIVDCIADKEKIKATQEEVDEEIRLMAQRYGHEFEQLKQVFRKNGTTNRIRAEIRERKTLDFLIGDK